MISGNKIYDNANNGYGRIALPEIHTCTCTCELMLWEVKSKSIEDVEVTEDIACIGFVKPDSCLLWFWSYNKLQ